MALSAYAPHVDYGAAMRAGSEAGLGRARITQAADEAAARLSYQYSALAAQERERKDALEARQQSAAEALRARQDEAGARRAEVKSQHAFQRGDREEASRQFNAAQALREKNVNSEIEHRKALEMGRGGVTAPSKIDSTYHATQAKEGQRIYGDLNKIRNTWLTKLQAPDEVKESLPKIKADYEALNDQYQRQQELTRASRAPLEAAATPQPAQPSAANALAPQPQQSPLPYIGANVTSDKSSRAAAANKLAAENPDWTREQVLDAVKRLTAP